MQKIITFLGVLILCQICWAEQVTPPAIDAKPQAITTTKTPTFSGEALALKNYIENLFEQSRHLNSPDPHKKTNARNQLESAMDWDHTARLCLGGRWARESDKNRSGFKSLLKDVIIKTAFSRIDKFWEGGTTYQFDKIDVKGNRAAVVAKFMVKDDFFTLGYFFEKQGNRWAMYDLSYEDLRYGANINEQIEAFLKEKNFTALLDRLRKRREELIREEKESAVKKS